MSTEPWYSEGLRFECTGCGNCCTGSPGFVWVDEDELAAIAEYRDKPVGEVRLLEARFVRARVSLREHANGDCVYLDPDSRRCTIYPVRPKQCRTWPFWRSNLESPESWRELRRECPGAGHGPLVTLDEIEERAGEIEI